MPLTAGLTGYGPGACQLVTGTALDGDGVPVVVQRLGNAGPHCIGVSRRRTCYFCKEKEEKFEQLKVQRLTFGLISGLFTLLINALASVCLTTDVLQS